MTPKTFIVNGLIATEPFPANFVQTRGAERGYKDIVQKFTLTGLKVLYPTNAPFNLVPGDTIYVRGDVAGTNAAKTLLEHTPAPVGQNGEPVKETPEQVRARQFILILEPQVVGIERLADREAEAPKETPGEAMARRLKDAKAVVSGEVTNPEYASSLDKVVVSVGLGLAKGALDTLAPSKG